MQILQSYKAWAGIFDTPGTVDCILKPLCANCYHLRGRKMSSKGHLCPDVKSYGKNKNAVQRKISGLSGICPDA